MDKSEMMKRYEAETGKKSVRVMTDGIHAVAFDVWHFEYINWLESKAAAYDRLMSGGKKTLNELANFLGKPITVDKSGAIFAHEFVPHTSFGEMWVSNLFDCMAIHPNLIDYTGGWKVSLTLPDGWEG